MQQTIIFVLYDSITNSVFDGQIAQPLLLKKKNNPETTLILISFEKNVRQRIIQAIMDRYPEIRFIILKKYLFIHRFLLKPLIKNLHSILQDFSSYTLIARGPIAAYLCHKAVRTAECLEMIIQARGLLAEEYRYVHQQSTFLPKLIHNIRAHFFEALEKISYSPKKIHTFPVSIETVSVALKEYLIQNYHAHENSISLTYTDIPSAITHDLRIQWRKEVRDTLRLTENYVYCYNGSIKPWQCPLETISFFKKQLQKNPKTHLLILSQDYKEFEQLLLHTKVPKGSYTVLCVAHKDIYRYLAASDAGLLFREKNILNWVSRPTKALEYQAVGLPIVHNNTIGFLQK